MLQDVVKKKTRAGGGLGTHCPRATRLVGQPARPPPPSALGAHLRGFPRGGAKSTLLWSTSGGRGGGAPVPSPWGCFLLRTELRLSFRASRMPSAFSFLDRPLVGVTCSSDALAPRKKREREVRLALRHPRPAALLLHLTHPPHPIQPGPLPWHLHSEHDGNIHEALRFLLLFFHHRTFWCHEDEVLEGFSCGGHPLLRVADHRVKCGRRNGRPRGTQSQAIQDLKDKRKPCLSFIIFIVTHFPYRH